MVALAPVPGAAREARPAAEAARRVDERRELRREVRFQSRRPIGRDRPGLLGRVDLGRRVGDEHRDEPVAALPGGRVHDRAEGLTCRELRPQVVHAHTEVRRSGGEWITEDHRTGPAARTEAALPVDELRNVVALRLRERGDEAVAGLPVLDGDVGEALAGDEFVAERALGDAEVGRREQLADIAAPSDAVLTTSSVTGSIELGPDGSVLAGSKIVVDLTTLRSNESRRDDFIKSSTLETRRYPTATFTVTSVGGLPTPLPDSGTWQFDLNGKLLIHGVERDVTWKATATRSGDQLTGTATITFTFEDFGMTAPRSFAVLSVKDEIRLEVALTAARRAG